jgi:beta-xylosidase
LVYESEWNVVLLKAACEWGENIAPQRTGCEGDYIDTASRKIMWLKIWTSNSDPRLIGRWYLEFRYEHKIMPSVLRLDKGTETRIMSTMPAFLHSDHKDMDHEDTVMYGPSTSNQVSMTTQGHCDVHAYSAMQNIKLVFGEVQSAIPIIIRTPLLRNRFLTPLEFLQIFM